MNSDFLTEIKNAEQEADAIVKNALDKAKVRFEESKKNFSHNLDEERKKSEEFIKSNRTSLTQESELLIENKLAEHELPVISIEQISDVSEKVLERIVNLLGNS